MNERLASFWGLVLNDGQVFWKNVDVDLPKMCFEIRLPFWLYKWFVEYFDNV